MTLEICFPRLIRLQNVILYNFLPKDIQYYSSLYSLYQYLRYIILFNAWSFSNIIVVNELLFIALNYSLWKFFDFFWTATANSFHFIGFCYWTLPFRFYQKHSITFLYANPDFGIFCITSFCSIHDLFPIILY